MNSLKLSKELGVKPSVIVKEVEKLRECQFKKNTTNIKISVDEANAIRGLLLPKEATKEVITEDKPSATKE
ncbi:MAG: hypothetical protein SNJ53_07870, partial [Thermodesulfovibrionales bacterium]